MNSKLSLILIFLSFVYLNIFVDGISYATSKKYIKGEFVPCNYEHCSRVFENQMKDQLANCTNENKINQRIDDLSPNMRRCCHFSKFITCIDESVKKPECKPVSSLIKLYEYPILSRKCSNYTYYSMTCLLAIWIPDLLGF